MPRIKQHSDKTTKIRTDNLANKIKRAEDSLWNLSARGAPEIMRALYCSWCRMDGAVSKLILSSHLLAYHKASWLIQCGSGRSTYSKFDFWRVEEWPSQTSATQKLDQGWRGWGTPINGTVSRERSGASDCVAFEQRNTEDAPFPQTSKHWSRQF